MPSIQPPGWLVILDKFVSWHIGSYQSAVVQYRSQQPCDVEFIAADVWRGG